MSVLLILRVEIVCAIILVFVLAYSKAYGQGEEKKFQQISFLTLIYVLFDGITVYTVNNLDTVPGFINWISHLMFYYFGTLFCHFFFSYVVKISLPNKRAHKYIKYTRIITIMGMMILPFLNFEYVIGRGTNYSLGSAAVLGYSLAFFHAMASMYIIITRRHWLDKYILLALIPTTSFLIFAMTIQIIIPELLATGASATLVTVSMFFSLENPALRYRERAYIDIGTGVKNRNFYEEDIKVLNERYFAKRRNGHIGVVICDLNNLKQTNDKYGHSSGDRLIQAAAKVLSESLESAYNIYRIGGDEFAAIYLPDKVEKIEQDVQRAKNNACIHFENDNYCLEMAIGYKSSTPEDLDIYTVIEAADRDMYNEKLKMKK